MNIQIKNTVYGFIIGVVIGLIVISTLMIILQNEYIKRLESMIQFTADEMASYKVVNDRLLAIQENSIKRRR